MRILSRLSMLTVLIALVTWAVIQEPLETQESTLPQGPQIPFDIQGPT